MKTLYFKRTKDTATYFSISVMTLSRWRLLEDFPQPLKRAGVVLYDVHAIEQWLANGSKEAAQ